jgi:peptidyl-prolyl cis-trans isomerase SurA
MNKPTFLLCPSCKPWCEPVAVMLAAWLALACGVAQAQTLRLPTAPSASASRSSQPQPADFIVAIVNAEPITRNEVQARVALAQQQLSRQGKDVPSAQLARELLERLISERAQLQLAKTLNLRPDEAAVDEAVAGVARQNQLTLEQLKKRIVEDGMDFVRFRNDLREELTLQRLREREVDARVKVTEQDIDQFFRERQAQAAAGPEQLNVAQILVTVPEDAGPDQQAALQAKAQRALARLRAGETFATVATEMSDAADRASGGELGLRPVERLPTLFVDAVRELPVGGLAGPLRSGAGWHVIKLVEKSRAAPAISVVQTRARHILLRPSEQLSERAARDRLADFKRRVLAGQADFAALAREHSQDGSAAEGGDLGWASPGMFVPEFEQVMNQLAPGQLADPLVSRFGVHLIQVLARREAPLSEREQRELARNLVREKKIAEAFAQWVQDVRGRAYVEFRE